MKTTIRTCIRVVTLLGILCLTVALFVSCGGDFESPETTGSPSTAGLVFSENADGTLSVTGYIGAEADVVIDIHEGKTVTEVAASAFLGNKTVKSVTLGAGVKTIGVAAFADCTALASMDAASSSLTRIANAAFLGCDALVSVSLPSTLGSIGVDAFLACDALTTLAFDGDGAAWTRVSIGAHNDVLNDIVMLANGEKFEGAFLSGDCSATVKWLMDAEGNLTVTGKGHMPDYDYQGAPWFEFADSIKTVLVDDGIDIVGKNAFSGCTELVSVTFAESVRLIDDSAFYGCVNLSEVTLPQNLRRIGAGAFYGCEHLRAVVIPDSVTHIGGGAFMNCMRLAEVTLGGGITAVEQWTFSGCERLMRIEIPEGVTEIGVGAFYGCTHLSAVTLGGASMSVGKNAFRGCDNLSAVIFRGGEWTVDDSNTDFITAIQK